ncbi:hypothetical protein F2Q68_00003505 [Brassica cretica]|uniref:Uncharacterized protein n=1 Tax=Brassica cretica TaxID=69181 RepID=A0A8S9JMH1_BRACR|nr:hypothetical protein F2Q68_00003505 [Brassica cretica]
MFYSIRAKDSGHALYACELTGSELRLWATFLLFLRAGFADQCSMRNVESSSPVYDFLVFVFLLANPFLMSWVCLAMLYSEGYVTSRGCANYAAAHELPAHLLSDP